MNAVGRSEGVRSQAATLDSRRLSMRLAPIVVGVPLVLFIAVLWPSLHSMWIHSFGYSHGYLVLALAVWLAATEVRRAPLAAPRPSWLGLLALTIAVALALSAVAADVRVGEQLAVPILLYTTLWGAAGGATARRFFWPIAYLIFGISVWGYINEPLRALTTAVAGGLTRLVGIPAFIGANEIHIPAGTFSVEEGCSGLHYVIAAGALSFFYGLTNCGRWRGRLTLLVAAVAAALVANWLRVFTVVVVGQVTDMQSFLVKNHYYFGWALFFVVLAPVFIMARFLEPAMRRDVHRSARGVVAPPKLAPLTNLAVTGLAFAVLLSGAALAFSVSRDSVSTTYTSTGIAFPPSLGDWKYAGEWTGATLPRFVGAERAAGAKYLKGAGEVNIYVAVYDAQRQGAELIYYANSPAGRKADVPVRRLGPIDMPLDEGAPVPGVELRVGSARRLVWYTYDVAGWHVTRPAAAKLYQVLGRLLHRNSASALVLSAACDPDCAAARSRLTDFASGAGRAVFPRDDDAKAKTPGSTRLRTSRN